MDELIKRAFLAVPDASCDEAESDCKLTLGKHRHAWQRCSDARFIVFQILQ
jgi:hypothetical protein